MAIMFIKKSAIETHRIPTEIREQIQSMLVHGRDEDNQVFMECMQGYIMTLDEKLRATALECQGRVVLYNTLIELFS